MSPLQERTVGAVMMAVKRDKVLALEAGRPTR
jgi:hypothetical protein